VCAWVSVCVRTVVCMLLLLLMRANDHKMCICVRACMCVSVCSRKRVFV